MYIIYLKSHDKNVLKRVIFFFIHMYIVYLKSHDKHVLKIVKKIAKYS